MPYNIIYADPPWAYREQMYHNGEVNSSAEHHYPTMTEEELTNLQVKDLAAKDCLLFLWATGPNLDQAMRVGTAWGFEYKTVAFVWHKKKPNPGSYTMSACEFCLVFKKGRIPKPRGARNVRQFVEARASVHSRKPSQVADSIEKMFPGLPKIELFARKGPELFSTRGWHYWGNQAKSDVTLTSREDANVQL